ncbi:hypothetical protein [Streptomyces sp. NPDC021562]|uniref:hypothetical protein n=1 Tax=Streptomyces sp. NPDC021562 TaxID=3155121 RepID=UPI00104572AA
MRPLNVPVRLAVAVMAVAAAAGCVNVGDDAGKARPSHSAGHRGGDAVAGGSGVSGEGGAGYGGAVADGKRGHAGKPKPGESASASGQPARGGDSSGPDAPAQPGGSVAPGVPAGPPTGDPASPTPPAVTPTPPPASPPPPPPVSDPPSAEPSSSAHGETGPQLVQREPAPTAGAPA